MINGLTIHTFELKWKNAFDHDNFSLRIVDEINIFLN